MNAGLNSSKLALILTVGVISIAILGSMPAVHAGHNTGMSVSAENPLFENHITGPQVIEVTISDPDIGRLDRAQNEPDVTVNGAKLRMVQADNGNWYGYFADRAMAKIADKTSPAEGQGLDFGVIHDITAANDGTFAIGADLSDADGFAAPPNINVVREAKRINTSVPGQGQIGINDNMWPFIQLYDFDPADHVMVQYSKPYSTQDVTLVFDTADIYAGLEPDRHTYPPSAQLHATITDTWLNVDPTDEDSWTFDSLNGGIHYQIFDKEGNGMSDYADSLTEYLEDMMCGGCKLLMDVDYQNTGADVIGLQRNANSSDENISFEDSDYITVIEQKPNGGVFGTYDKSGISELYINNDAQRGTVATLDYNNTETIIQVGYSTGAISIPQIEDTWKSGEEILIVIEDGDANRNGRIAESLTVDNPDTLLIPALETGDPFTLGQAGTGSDTSARAVLAHFRLTAGAGAEITNQVQTSTVVDMFSDRAVIVPDESSDIVVNSIIIDFNTDIYELRETLFDPTDSDFRGFNFYNHDVQSLDPRATYDVYLLHSEEPVIGKLGVVNGDLSVTRLVGDIRAQGDLVPIDAGTASDLASNPAITSHSVGLAIVSGGEYSSGNLGTLPIVADFFSYGFIGDGTLEEQRVTNQIIRIEAEETGANTGTFEGEMEYTMLNQLNILDVHTYQGLNTVTNDPEFIASENFTDRDSVRVNYLDLNADGAAAPISARQEIPTHSATVSLDSDTYEVAETVTVTLEDADLNTHSDIFDIYTISTLADTVGEKITFDGKDVEFDGYNLGTILDVTFDDLLWATPVDNQCGFADFTGNTGLAATGFVLVETDPDTGIFTGNFQVPAELCQDGLLAGTIGTDLEVNYVDFRNASGETVHVGAGADISAHAGSVSLDRTVYPVPFGPDVFATNAGYLPQGDVAVRVLVDDPDFDASPNSVDMIDVEGIAPVKIYVQRGSEEFVLGYAGGHVPQAQLDRQGMVDFGAIKEIAPDAGIFEVYITISHADGPEGSHCPDFDNCILQGDILRVEYTDTAFVAGDLNTVVDSAVFDLRDGQLLPDKSVYRAGSDMILTLIEPDFDLDYDKTETYPLHLIEWYSDAYTGTMGGVPEFDPEPPGLWETGDSTGIFQTVIKIPAEIGGDRLERNEKIMLEYVDYGPAGADYVGHGTKDINMTIFTSDLGATVELDQETYTWTDKVYITIVAPDHDFDSSLVDEIGDTYDPVRVSTMGDSLDMYKLVETGTDTGIFTGEVILIGFDHNADGNIFTGEAGTGYDNPQRESGGNDKGPTDGYLMADRNDKITVEFEFSEGRTVEGSAPIVWNVGEIQWLDASYPATGTGVARVIDPDMNLDPEVVDSFTVDVWSDSDAGGIDLTVTETNEATGIFEGTVFFTAYESSGHMLKVAEGDTVTAEYADNTLPDPYTAANEIDVSATTLIFPSDHITLEISAYGDANDNGTWDAGEDPFQGLLILTYTQSTGTVNVWITGDDGRESAVLAPTAFYAIAMPAPGYKITTNPLVLGGTAYNGVLSVEFPPTLSTHSMEIGVATDTP